MAVRQVFGNDVAINIGGASGNFELNVFKPLIIHNFLQSARLLADGCDSFNEHCAVGIEPNRERIDEHLRELADAGDRAQPAHRLRQGREDREEGAQEGHRRCARPRSSSGYVTGEQFDQWVRPEKMVGTKNS